MSDIVWLSSLQSAAPVRDYVSTAKEGLQAKQSVAAQMNWQGDVVPDIAIPKVFRPAKAKTAKLREITLLRDRFLLIGPKTSKIVSQFNLGQGTLHPVTIENHDGSVASEGEYFFWNFGNKLTYFRPEDSVGLSKSNYGNEKPGEHIYSFNGIPKDNQVALSQDCLNGPDVWREKFLATGILMSDQLACALRGTGLDVVLELTSCRIV